MNRKLMAGGALAAFLFAAVGANAYHIDADGCHDTVTPLNLRTLCVLDDNNTPLEVAFAGDPLYWDLNTTLIYPGPDISVPDPENLTGPPLFTIKHNDILFGLILCEQNEFIGNIIFPLHSPVGDFSTEGHGGLCFMSPGYSTDTGTLECRWNGRATATSQDRSFPAVAGGATSVLGRSNGIVPAVSRAGPASKTWPSDGDKTDGYANTVGGCGVLGAAPTAQPANAAGDLGTTVLPIAFNGDRDWYTVEMIPASHNTVNPDLGFALPDTGHTTVRQPAGSTCPDLLIPPWPLPNPVPVEIYDCVGGNATAIPFAPQYDGVDGPTTLMAAYDAKDAYASDYGHISGFPAAVPGGADGSYRMNRLGNVVGPSGCPALGFTPVDTLSGLPFCTK